MAMLNIQMVSLFAKPITSHIQENHDNRYQSPCHSVTMMIKAPVIPAVKSIDCCQISLKSL